MSPIRPGRLKPRSPYGYALPLAAAILAALAIVLLGLREREIPLVRNAERSHFTFGPVSARAIQSFTAADGVLVGIAFNAAASGEPGTLEVRLWDRPPHDGPPLRETVMPVPTRGNISGWVAARFDPVAVAAGRHLWVSVDPVAAGGRVGLAASRFDQYADGVLTDTAGPSYGDQDLAFQAIYNVRPVGYFRVLAAANPLLAAAAVAIAGLAVWMLRTLVQRPDRSGLRIGTAAAWLVAVAGVGLAGAWLYSVLPVVARGAI